MITELTKDERGSDLTLTITFFNQFYIFCNFELEQINEMDPAITFLTDFKCCCHFELGQISEPDPVTITF